MANGYKKIASGARVGRLSSGGMSLWQGADHLLQIEKDGYSENYKRFYFSDIEQFAIRIDRRQWTITFILGATVGIFLFIALLNTGLARGLFAGFGGFFFLPMIYNWMRGPTCVVHVASAVQREELSSVRRVKSAKRLLNVLREAAAESQGVIPPDLVRAKFAAQNAPPAPPPISPVVAPGLPPLETPESPPLQ